MKKYLQVLFIVLFPYVIILTLAAVFTGFIKKINGSGVAGVFLLWALCYLAGLASAAWILIGGMIKRRDGLELLRLNLIVKVLHIPAYIMFFLIGLVCLTTIFTYMFTVVVVLLVCMNIFLTGLIGLAGVLRSKVEKKLSGKAAVLHGILQFFLFADMISAIIVYRKVKKAI